MAFVIGLIYDKNENWIAGSYYIENLISALATLTDDKPVLKIYTSSKKAFDDLRKNTQYPLLEFHELADFNSLADRIINKISYLLFNKHWIVRGIDSQVDILFPASDSYYFEKFKKRLYWIPDFQEKEYPVFFNEEELKRRTTFQKQLVKKGAPIVFSSQHAQADFNELFPTAKNQTYVMPFAVTLPSLMGIKWDDVKVKYGIEKPYFICCNQFWIHKNHLVVLKAIKNLKLKNREVYVVFTGKPYDHRNPDYYQKLIQFANENQLSECIGFLGFVDRVDQLMLIKHSLGVIQPSLFEGWSTIIEDAKSLSVPIIASDIAVHREQLPDYSFFFPKESEEALGNKMIEIQAHPPKMKSDYPDQVVAFGRRFMDIVRKVTT